MNKSLWIGLILAVTIGTLWQFIPLKDASERLEKLPLKGITYIGKNIALTPGEKKFFRDINVLKRNYVINGQRFFVTILDGTDNRHLIHDPYYCFKGGGREIISTQTISVNGIDTQKVRLQGNDGINEAIFWFSDGNNRFHSPIRYWLSTTLRRITLGLSGEEPVLIFVLAHDGEQTNWNAVLEAFPPILKL